VTGRNGAVRPLGKPQLVPTGDVHPYPGNPRKITPKAIEQTAESIRTFGWQQPLVCDSQMVLVVGHVRLEAARLLGLPRVPVIIAGHLSEAEARAYRIADNRTGDYTAWDYAALAAELDGLPSDFARVLDLADWEGIIAGFQAQAEQPPLLDGEAAALAASSYQITVVFSSREAAGLAGPAILKLDGVLDIRYAV
jgi:hypothetical protein